MALRQGPEGATVAAASGEAWRLPAAPDVQVVDTTGAYTAVLFFEPMRAF